MLSGQRQLGTPIFTLPSWRLDAGRTEPSEEPRAVEIPGEYERCGACFQVFMVHAGASFS